MLTFSGLAVVKLGLGCDLVQTFSGLVVLVGRVRILCEIKC